MYSGAYIVYCMLVYYFSVQSRTIYTFGARSFAPAVETSKITLYLPVSSLHHMKDENFRLVSPIDSDMNMHNYKVGPLPAISRGGVIAFSFFFRGYKPSYPSIRPFEGLVTYNPVVLMAHLVDLSTPSTFSGPKHMGGISGMITWNKDPVLKSIPSEVAKPYARLKFMEGEKHIDSHLVEVEGLFGDGRHLHKKG